MNVRLRGLLATVSPSPFKALENWQPADDTTSAAYNLKAEAGELTFDCAMSANLAMRHWGIETKQAALADLLAKIEPAGNA